MKVHTEGLGGAASLETSRTQEAARASHGEPRHAAPATTGQDSIQISDLSTQITKVSAQEQARIAGRVSELAALYARGEYRTDAATLSRALVSHALDRPVEGAE